MALTEKLSSCLNDMYAMIQETPNGLDCLKLIYRSLQNSTKASIIALDIDGKILAYECLKGHPIFNKNNSSWIEPQFNEQLRHMTDIKCNLTLEYCLIKTVPKQELSQYYALVFPLTAYMERLGSIVLYKETLFEPEEILVTKVYASISAMNLYQYQFEKNIAHLQQVNIVKSAVDTLSYSELEAVIEIFNELRGCEGLIVASRVAERAGITRSVIVNALRKFESAGIIESRSLGMKGTYIKVINPLLLEELNKFRR